jgi:DNA-binding NarL/FixJ family response regulator
MDGNNNNNKNLIKKYGLADEHARVLARIMEGDSNPEIAAHCLRSESWVKWKVSELLALLSCQSRCQAMAKMWKEGWGFQAPVVSKPVATGLPLGVLPVGVSDGGQ